MICYFARSGGEITEIQRRWFIAWHWNKNTKMIAQLTALWLTTFSLLGGLKRSDNDIWQIIKSAESSLGDSDWRSICWSPFDSRFTDVDCSMKLVQYAKLACVTNWLITAALSSSASDVDGTHAFRFQLHYTPTLSSKMNLWLNSVRSCLRWIAVSRNQVDTFPSGAAN